MRSACLLTAWITFLSVSFFLLPDGIFYFSFGRLGFVAGISMASLALRYSNTPPSGFCSPLDIGRHDFTAFKGRVWLFFIQFFSLARVWVTFSAALAKLLMLHQQFTTMYSILSATLRYPQKFLPFPFHNMN
jgi:hypothetical protein